MDLLASTCIIHRSVNVQEYGGFCSLRFSPRLLSISGCRCHRILKQWTMVDPESNIHKDLIIDTKVSDSILQSILPFCLIHGALTSPKKKPFSLIPAPQFPTSRLTTTLTVILLLHVVSTRPHSYSTKHQGKRSCLARSGVRCPVLCCVVRRMDGWMCRWILLP